jgi:hypothetical protein
MIDGNGQSDVTPHELEELSRPPKHTKTTHVLGQCQKVCQDGAKLQRTTVVAFFVSKFVPALKSRGWDTPNKLLPKNSPDREKTYTELQTTLDQEGIRLIRMRRGVSSGSDEVGSLSQSTRTQTNSDKDEMEDVVDGEENVDHEEEVVRNNDDKEEKEVDVLDENEEKDGEEDEDEDGDKVEEEVLEEGEEDGEEEEEETSQK